MEENKFHSLVKKYFEGKLKDNEYSILLEQLKDENKSIQFQELKEKWEVQPTSDLQLMVNWKRLSYKMSSKELKPNDQVKPINKWIQFVAVAAMLVIGIFLGGLLEWGSMFEKSIIEKELVFETPRGDKSKVTLPDGTEVWLNANSKLVYHPSNKKERSVELLGEALFKVTSNKDLPFIVHTNECKVRVLGTTFNVMAYENFGRKEITLLEGRVEVEVNDVRESLNPGEAFILKENEYQIVEGNTTQASSWINNQFYFKDIPVLELMKRLENWYDVDIELINNNDSGENFTGVFKNEETIWQLLDALNLYIPLNYERNEVRKIKVTIR